MVGRVFFLEGWPIFRCELSVLGRVYIRRNHESKCVFLFLNLHSSKVAFPFCFSQKKRWRRSFQPGICFLIHNNQTSFKPSLPPKKNVAINQSMAKCKTSLGFYITCLVFYCQFWTFFSCGWLDDWWPDWGCWVQAKHRLVPRGPNSCSSVSEVVSVRGSGFAPVNRGEVGFQKINGQLGWVITPDIGEGVMNITPKVWNISAMMLFFFWRHLWKVFSVGGFVDSMIHPKIIE